LRYQIEPSTGLPYTETSPGLLAFTVGIALVTGVILFFVGRYGRQLWLIVWSIGLVICSIAYLIWYFYRY
jgi:energy-coupling factor transporter transmembrane protein EcfT